MIATRGNSLLLINGAVLLVCAVFDFEQRDTLLIALMLFLPLLDRQWQFARPLSYRHQWTIRTVLVLCVAFIALVDQAHGMFILYTLLLVALPEEWFFRAYFMPGVEAITGNKLAANASASALFAVLHVPVQGWAGLSVFVPSMILGWIYQQHRDIVLVVLLHALSNLVFILYLRRVLYPG